MAQLGNNSTFNRSLLNATGDRTVKGYHSRTVFSYATENLINLYNTDVTNEADTEGIQFLIDNSGTNDYHGTHIIPAYYWRPGKVFRVSGTIIVDDTNGIGVEELNMRFGLNAGGLINPAWLAIQNNNNNHTFSNADPSGPLPVDFSCDIFCSRVETDATNAYFGASGYYQYTYANFNSVGEDRGSIHVPVWSSTFATTGLEEVYTGQSTIMFNLFGTTTDPTVYITRLTIEELA
jgi:hypothetical protein